MKNEDALKKNNVPFPKNEEIGFSKKNPEKLKVNDFFIQFCQDLDKFKNAGKEISN